MTLLHLLCTSCGVVIYQRWKGRQEVAMQQVSDVSNACTTVVVVGDIKDHPVTR